MTEEERNIIGGSCGCAICKEESIEALRKYVEGFKTTSAAQADQLSKADAEIDALRNGLIRTAEEDEIIKKLTERAETAEATVASMDSVEESHRADCHGLSQRIEELQRKLEFLNGEDGCEHARRYWEDETDDQGDPYDNCVACERDKLREACEAMTKAGRLLGNLSVGYGPSQANKNNFYTALSQGDAALDKGGEESGGW